MERARLTDDETENQGALGMKIDKFAEEGNVKEDETGAVIVKPHSSQKKTKAQRNKESKRLSEV